MPKTLQVRLTPNAKKNELGGWAEDENGAPYLKAYVTAVPERGKANKALIALLAKTFRVSKSEISILRGQNDRVKTLQIPDRVLLEI